MDKQFRSEFTAVLCDTETIDNVIGQTSWNTCALCDVDASKHNT